MGYVITRQWGLMVAALVLLVDALSKGWILQHVQDLPLVVIEGWFSLVLAWNRGMSFSFLSDAGAWGPWLLGGLAVLACAWFVHWMGNPEHRGRGLHLLGLGLVTGGALGNVLDRVQHGAVVDFLLVHWQDHYFPVFNVADSAISLGVGLLLWDSVCQAREDRRRDKAEAVSAET